jgi:cysteine desulfurase
MDLIYLDNNATTPMLPEVAEAMRPFLTDVYGNPASAHQAGRRARQALEDAREKTAAILDAHPDEVVFTSGGTEANNLALLGLAGEPPGHIVTSPIEHPSVAEPVQQLEKQGFAVDRLPVDREGLVEAQALSGLLRADTRLVTVMLANNEVGTIEPIAELVDLVDERAAFHCDAVQAAGRIPVSFRDLKVTTLAISAHKFHGPKGVGALLARRKTKLRPRFMGGHQQQGRRPGTEPVALAVGLATALELWQREQGERTARVRSLRRQLLEVLEAAADPVILNGPRETGVPHTVNLSFPGCRADSLLMNLDLAGVACSTGSACSSGSLLPSPVLQAMNAPKEVLHSAMRFSLSPLLTENQVREAARRVTEVVGRLRRSESPDGLEPSSTASHAPPPIGESAKEARVPTEKASWHSRLLP